MTTNDTSPDQVIWWLNYVEQVNPYISFIPDKDNVITDCNNSGNEMITNMAILITTVVVVVVKFMMLMEAVW